MAELQEVAYSAPEALEIEGVGGRALRVALMSDTHVEFYGAADAVKPGGKFAPPPADVLVLAGDVGIPGGGAVPLGSEPQYTQLIYAHAEQYPYVLVILGNHEFYSGEYEQRRALAAQVCRDAPRRNVRLLDCHSVVFNKQWLFAGCTLWSHVPEAAKEQVGSSLNDYRTIQWKREGVGASGLPWPSARLRPEDTNAWHGRELRWLQRALEEARGAGLSTAVVTHHAPLIRGISHPKHEGACVEDNPTGHAFGTDLSSSGVMEAGAKLWMFGHTHYSTDKMVGGVRVVSNQVGYPHERDERYRKDLLLELPPP